MTIKAGDTVRLTDNSPNCAGIIGKVIITSPYGIPKVKVAWDDGDSTWVPAVYLEAISR